MPMQIRRTSTADNPPTALAEGQLAVEMASTPPKLWVGVPVAISSNQRVQLNDFATQAWVTAAIAGAGHLSDPTTVGNFLRSNTGTWVAGLPLAGGIMTGPITFAAGQTITGYLPLTGGTLAAMTDATAGINLGLSLTINRSAAWQNAIALTNNSTSGTAAGLSVTNGAAGRGITVGNNSNGNGLYIDCGSASTGAGFALLMRSGSTGRGLDINRGTNANAINIYDAAGSTATTAPALIVSTNVTNSPGISVNSGTGAPLVINGQAVSFGDPDSGGTGYRCLRVPN